MFRKNIYKWHRSISLLIAIPVILWAASGFMHPIMTTIRPKIATQFLTPSVIDSTKITIGLQTVLLQNRIEKFHNFRLIHIDTNWFYQVQLKPNDHPLYLSTKTGKQLINGDQLYAQYIAQLFLEGQPKPDSNLYPTASLQSISSAVEEEKPGNPADATAAHDCCDAATNCVLLNEKGSKVTGLKLINAFDEEYKFVNRLLPVYKVNFGRADGIRIYVETTSDRFAYAVDNKRAVFDKIFALFHNWTWMDAIGNAKYFVMAALLILAFVTTLMGIYIFFITKAKKPNGNQVINARRNHRWTSVAISLFTLMFTFSGAFHALDKLKPDTRYDYFTEQNIPAYDAALNLTQLQQAVKKPITNISVVQLNDEPYWQVFTKSEWKSKGAEAARPRKDLMKDKSVPPPNATYVNTKDYSVLADGEKIYACYLANLFSKHSNKDIVATEAITKFEGEYGFVNKRLPVWKISYPTNSNERYYVESSTGKLSVRVNDMDLIEGYSFAMLHKHHFMDFAGKEVRDFSTMFWAMAQIAVVAVGLILWRRVRKNKRPKEAA